MTERPILMSGPMVRALLAGKKTQTRRVVKLRGAESIDETDAIGCYWPWSPEADDWAPCPYGRPGDRLWVKETFATLVPTADKATAVAHRDRVVLRPDDDEPIALWYRADGEMPFVEQLFSDEEDGIRWRPSIHMPRWASRLTLEVTAVRVERLQVISGEDAVAEGVDLKSEAWLDSPQTIPISLKPRFAFELLWKSINGAESWAANPWVWVVSFKRVTP